MKILGIETSCDETAAAVVENGRRIISSLVSSQIDLHKKYYGVVPELASRKHLEIINPLINECLTNAQLTFNDIDAIAVVNRPGLVIALIIGVSVAKSLAQAAHLPLIAVNHLTAHLYAAHMTNTVKYPAIGLLVSGGHTLLMSVDKSFNITVYGTTVDDAIGEAYDKIAKYFKLGYPGGPVIDRIAARFRGNPKSIMPFTPPNMKNKEQRRYCVSYSGLKTATTFYSKKHPEIPPGDMVAAFQYHAINMIYSKALLLARDLNIPRIIIAGGVAGNSYLRHLFNTNPDITAYFPPHELCTDNAAMVAGYGYVCAQKKEWADMTLNAYARSSFSVRYTL